MSVFSLLAFLSAAVISAFVLVLAYRQEELLQPDFDHDGAWFTATPGASVAAMAMTALTQATFATLLAMTSVTLWHLAAQFGLLPPPQEADAFIRALESIDEPYKYLVLPLAFIQAPLLHFVAIGWLVVLFALTAWRTTDRSLYDIFISYKSEDAPLARRIADALLATGWRVWFAEYQIVLHWRAYFRAMFVSGITHSRFGLAITNDKWASSPHCAMEARLLLFKLPTDALIELRAPSEPLPHRRHPDLAHCRSLETRDVNAIVRFLEEATRNPFPGAPLAEPVGGARHTGTHAGRPCSIDAAGWSATTPGHGTLTEVDWIYDGLPDTTLWSRLTITPIDAAELENKQRFGMDERHMFEVLAYRLRKGLRQIPKDVAALPARQARDAKLQRRRSKMRGAHLLFHDGRPQVGLTYWPGVRDMWRRVVSLDIQNPVTGGAANFSFHFIFHGTFRDYCRHAHIMDALALSLKWD